jgi:nickel-dependent lactate racemase
VENHDARDDAIHVDLGSTRTRGTPVKLNRLFVDADLKIATGLVEPHFMAGWSGGRKVVAPGVAHHETIRTFHSARFMEDPLAVQCNLVGNPLHEEQLEIVRMLGDVYALNVVIDEDRDLVFASFGEIVSSHAAAVAFVSRATHVPASRKFATVVTSSAGYPLDKTYYQTIKGMVTPLAILEPGGTLIIASECSEGFGSREFREAQARLVAVGQERFLATLTAKRLADIDEWQTEMQLKSLRLGRVELYTTGLKPEEQAITGVHVVPDVSAAIAASIERSADPAVAVIPEGPYVIPYFAG